MVAGVEVYELRYSFSGTSTSTDYWPDSYGIFVYLFEKVQLLGSGHAICLKGEIVSGDVVYHASVMQVLYIFVYSYSEVYCWVAVYLSVDGVV